MFDEILAWFESKRVGMRYHSLSQLEKQFNSALPKTTQYTAYAMGSFDEKIVVIANTDNTKYLCCSIDVNIIDTFFYSSCCIYQPPDFTSDHAMIISSDADLIKSLLNPRIALLSLAKNDIYTFPRFALGIADIAYTIRKNFLGSVSLHDLQLEESVEKFTEFIKRENIDIVGISVTFGLFDVLSEVIESLRSSGARCRIVIGGSLAGMVYKEILLKFPEVIISLSDGETFIKRYIEYYHGIINISDIPCIAYYDTTNQEVIENSPKNQHSDPYTFPMPELDLLLPTLLKNGVFQLESSRGCYNACSFCPRRHKGNWRNSASDIEKIETLIDHFKFRLRSQDLNPWDYIVYVVDEEFVGGGTDHLQNRAIAISKLFSKNDLRFETSFRMNTIYESDLTKDEYQHKLSTVIQMRDNGLNRVLIGVESGVQSILKRFKKNITSEENIAGIRLLSGLSVPVRFTYITFDPLMTLDELVETYRFQGRKDLILKPELKDNPKELFNLITGSADGLADYLNDEPFYYHISYMLVSIECLVGSKYFDILSEKELLGSKIIASLGKQEAHYEDARIGLMSHFAQLWIDRNFSLDYSLKSLSKIYDHKSSLKIREQRITLKRHSYRLLGKMLFTILSDYTLLTDYDCVELEFAEKSHIMFIKGVSLKVIFRSLLDHQFQLLLAAIMPLRGDMKQILKEKDYLNIENQLENWALKKEWVLLNEE